MAAKGLRRFIDDDLLTGFDETGPSGGHLRAYFASTAVIALYVWDVAFTYGAFHTIIYRNVQRVFVLAMVVLFGTLLVRRQVRVRWWLLALFAPPILMNALRLFLPINHPSAAVRLAHDVLLVASAVAAPLILWVIVRLLAPDYFTLPTRRLKVAVLATVAIIGLIGYLVGRYNYRFLTCEDFRATGEPRPANCVSRR